MFVNENNKNAISLYEKFDFKCISNLGNFSEFFDIYSARIY